MPLNSFLHKNRVKTLLWLIVIYFLNNFIAFSLAVFNQHLLPTETYLLVQGIRLLAILLQVGAFYAVFHNKFGTVRVLLLLSLGLSLGNSIFLPNHQALIAILSLTVTLSIALSVISTLYFNTRITALTALASILILNTFLLILDYHPGMVEPMTRTTSYAVGITLNFYLFMIGAFVTSINLGLSRLQNFITHLVYVDLKTGLENERQFELVVQRTIDKGEAFTLLVIDFKNLLQLNRQFGYRHIHQYYLQQLELVKKVMLPFGSPYKLEGPMLAFILKEASLNLHEVEATLTELVHQLKVKNLHVDNAPNLQLDYQWIATQYPSDSQTSQGLIDNIYHLKYSSDHHSTGAIKWYDQSAFERAKRTLTLEADLRETIERHGIAIALQPQLHLKQGEMRGYEVLARWHHPHYGIISPGEFIPMAERLGLINQLTEVIVNKAHKFQHQLTTQGHQAVSYAINIAATSISDGSILKLTADNQAFEIEITESTLMELNESARSTLSQIKERGFTLAIDDFGTGFSNLEYLHALDVDYLKIDKRFVDSMMTSEKALKLVEALIGMAHTLEIAVIAEGVETEMQFDVLKRLDCDYIQGYWYGKPMSPEDLMVFISRQARS